MSTSHSGLILQSSLQPGLRTPSEFFPRSFRWAENSSKLDSTLSPAYWQPKRWWHGPTLMLSLRVELERSRSLNNLLKTTRTVRGIEHLNRPILLLNFRFLLASSVKVGERSSIGTELHWKEDLMYWIWELFIVDIYFCWLLSELKNFYLWIVWYGCGYKSSKWKDKNFKRDFWFCVSKLNTFLLTVVRTLKLLSVDCVMGVATSRPSDKTRTFIVTFNFVFQNLSFVADCCQNLNNFYLWIVWYGCGYKSSK